MTDSLDAWATKAERAVKGRTPVTDPAVQRRPSERRPPGRKPARYAEAADLLESHNAWRRGAEGDMACTKAIGLAIDLAVKVLRQRHGYRS